MALFWCKPAWLWVWYVGRGRFGVQVELCCWSCSTQPRESSCTPPFLMQVPFPCSRASRCLPREMQKWCFNQSPHFPAWDSLWLTPCSWLILWLPWFWVSKMAKGKLIHRTMGREFFTEQDFLVKILRLSQLIGSHKKHLVSLSEGHRAQLAAFCSEFSQEVPCLLWILVLAEVETGFSTWFVSPVWYKATGNQHSSLH